MEELEYVKYVLHSAKIYGLEAEVMYTALSSMKEDPDMSIMQALDYGFIEWIK